VRRSNANNSPCRLGARLLHSALRRVGHPLEVLLLSGYGLSMLRMLRRLCAIGIGTAAAVWAGSCFVCCWCKSAHVRLTLYEGDFSVALSAAPLEGTLPPIAVGFSSRFDPRWSCPKLECASSEVYARVPLWSVVASLGVAYLALRGVSRGTPAVEGFCTCCGYSLTGNVSGRCPECGQACTKATGTGAPAGPRLPP
jgi:hypothetical protein